MVKIILKKIRNTSDDANAVANMPRNVLKPVGEKQTLFTYSCLNAIEYHKRL